MTQIHDFFLTPHDEIIEHYPHDALQRYPRVQLPDPLITAIAHTLIWIPTSKHNSKGMITDLSNGMQRDDWCILTHHSAPAMRAVLGGWRQVFAAHPEMLRIHAGELIQAGRRVRTCWYEHERAAVLEALDTLLLWSSRLEQQTHHIYHLSNVEPAISIAAPQDLDDDLIEVGGRSKPQGYHQLLTCRAADSPKEASSRGIKALHQLTGASYRGYAPRSPAEAAGVLIHEALAWAHYPLFLSQLDCRHFDQRERARGIT